MPDILDDIIAERKAKASQPATSNGGGQKPPSLSGTLPDPRYAGEVAPFDPGGDVLDQIIAERQGNSSIPGPATGEKPGVYFGSQDIAPPVIGGIPNNKSNEQAKKQVTYKDRNLLDSIAPGAAKFMREVEAAGGNPRTMLANREAAEEKRRENLRAEKKRVIDNINRAGMQGKGESSPYVQSMRRRLYDIDQALGGGPAPSVISSGKAATQSLTKPKVRIIDETGGKETSDQRRERLTSEFNYLGTSLNELGQDIQKSQIVIKAGQDRLNRLKSLIDQGQQNLVPEYNELVKRVQGISNSANKKVDDYERLSARMKPVLKAVNEYRSGDAKQNASVQMPEESFLDKFIDASRKFFLSEQVYGNYAANQVESGLGTELTSDQRQSIKKLAIEGDIQRGITPYDKGIFEFSRAITEIPRHVLKSLDVFQQPKQTAFDKLSGKPAPVDRYNQVASTLAEALPYFAPVVGQGLMIAQTGAFMGEVDANGPVAATMAFADGMNPFAKTTIDADTMQERPLRPEERAVRGLGLFLVALGGARGGKEYLSKRSALKYMTNKMGMPKSVASEFYDAIYPIYKSLNRTQIEYTQDRLINYFSRRKDAISRRNLELSELTPLERDMADLVGQIKSKTVDTEFWKSAYKLSEEQSVRGRVSNYYRKNGQGEPPEPPGSQGPDLSSDAAEPDIRGNLSNFDDKTSTVEDVVPQGEAGTVTRTEPQPIKYSFDDVMNLQERINAGDPAVQPTRNGNFLIETPNGVQVVAPGSRAGVFYPFNPNTYNKDQVKAQAAREADNVLGTTSTQSIPWDEGVFNAHLEQLNAKNIDGKLIHGGKYAGQPVVNVPVEDANKLVDTWRRLAVNEPNGQDKAELVHDINLLENHIAKQASTQQTDVKAGNKSTVHEVDVPEIGKYKVVNVGTDEKPIFEIHTPDSVWTKTYAKKDKAIEKLGTIIENDKSRISAPATETESGKPEGIKNIFKEESEREIAGFQDAIDKLPAVPKNLSAKKFSKESEDRVGNKAIHELLLRRALEKAIKDKDAFNGRVFAREVDDLARSKGHKGLPPASVDYLIEYLGLPEDFDPTALLTASEKQSNKPETKTLYRQGDTFEHQGTKYKIIEIADDRALVDDLTGGKTIATAIHKKFRPDFPIDWKAQGRASDFKSDQSNKTESETKPTQVKDEQTNKGPSLRLVPPGDEPKIGDKVTERSLRRFAKNWRPVEDSESALTDSAFDYEGTAIKIASAKIPGIYDDYAYALAFPDLSYIYLGKAQGKIDVENPSDEHIAILERAKEEAYSKITKQIDNHDWTKQINPGNQSPSEWVAEIAKKKNFGANRTWMAKDAAEWLMEHTAEYLVVPSKIDGDFKITYDKQAGKAYAYSSSGDISYLASIPYTGSYEETKLIENSFEGFLRGKTTSDFQQAKEIEAESISEPETKPTQVKDEPKTEAPSNDRQVKTGNTLFDTLREYDNKATDDELKELAADVDRVAKKTIKLWDDDWAQKENYRASFIDKIKDTIYNNAPMESNLVEMSDDVAQKIAETYIQPDIQFSRSDVQDEITKALYKMDVIRNVWKSGDKQNFELELTKQYDLFVGRRLGEFAKARNVRGAQLYNEQGPSGGDDYNAIRQEVIRLLGHLLGALPSNQSQTPPVRTSLTDGFDIRGNRRVVDSILAFPQMDPNTPVLNGKNWKEHTEKFEALVEQEVLQGKVVVVNMAPFKKYLGLTEEQEEELDPFSVPEIEAKTAGVIPLRWGAPRVLLVTPEQAKILDGGDEPLRVWRLWRYKFDPKTDAYIVGDPNAIWNELMRRSGVEPKTELKNEVKEALDEVVKSGTDAISNLTDDEIEEAELRAELEAMFDEALAEKTQASIKEAETRATQPKEPKLPRTNAPQPREPKQAPTKKDKAAEIASAFGEGVDANAVANILDILGNDGIVREDTPGYAHKSGPIRAVGTNDANPQRIKLAGQRFSWMVDREGSVLASAIASEWVRGNGSDLVGKVVTSFQDLAVAAQILRNPGYETFRWFAVKNGIVVAESAYSSRLPTSTVTFSQWIDSQGTNVQEWLKSFLDENEADGFYLLHNHPSGNPEPSLADVLLTKQIATWDRRFKGHVVINSTTYAKIDAKGEPQYFKLAKNDQKQVLALKAGPVVGRPVNGMATIAQIGADLKAPKGYVTMVAVDSKSKIRAVFEVSTNQFFGKEKHSAKWAAAYISKLRRSSGAAFMYAVIDRSDANGNIPRIKQAITTGFLDDVIILKSVEGTAKSNAESVRTSLTDVDENLSTRIGRPKIKGKVAREAGFSDQVYSQLKPELQKIWNAASSQGMDIKQFFAKLLEQFPATIRPYAIQFATEIRKGVNNAKDQRERDQLDGDQSPEEGAGAKDQQSDVRPDGRGGKSVQGDGVSDDAPVGADGRPREDDVAGTRGGRSGSGKRPAKNFVITDELGLGETTDGQKKRDLIAALELRQVLRNENRQPTKDEQIILARFPGTGWIGNRLNETESTDPEFRDKVKSLISAAELINFRRSLVNSHYTSIPLIDVHWDIAKRLGYKSGPAVETSAGIGHFLGRAPKGAEITAIEFEDTAAEIMGWLYPESNVIHSPFEKVPAYGDKLLAISNIPFAIGISDYDLQKEVGITGSSIRSHNYFFMKSLDHLVEGGLIIFTTSAGTLNARDAQARQTREYLASKADFIGAIRLPNNAFSQNAGTDVTTDIVIMRKRPEGAPNRSQRFTQLADVITKDGDTATINQYFVDHPEMVLGTHSMRGVMYGSAEKDGKFVNYTVNPIEGDLESQIKAAIDRLPRNILGDVELRDSKTKMSIPKVTPPADLRTYRIFEHEGNFYVKTGTYTSEPVVKQGGSNKGRSLNDKEKAQIKAYIEVRDRVRALLEINATTEGEKSLKVAQANLKSAYDDYVKKYKQFSATKNISELAMDEDWPTVKALEIIDPETKKVTGLAPIFTQRVIKYHAKIDKVDNATDALLASIHNYGKVDLGEMSKLSGIAEQQLINDLAGQIFNDPKLDKWVTADEYGSGNVKAKYKEAKELAEIDESYKAHVEFLESRLPEDIKADDIFVQIGAKWIPIGYYNQFINDVFGYNPKITKTDEGKFVVTNPAPGKDLDVYVTEVQEVGDGTTRVVQGDSHPFSDVLQIALSNKSAKIMRVEVQGDPPKFQPDLSQAVNERIALLREEWNYYWKGDEKLSSEIAQLYNDFVNVYQFRSYDGSFLTLPGSTATMGGRPFSLRPWQKDQILRTIVNDFAYAAHGVGTGKTFEIIGGAMELRRIGKRNKILIATLKANKEAIAADFLKMYPDARILVSQEVSMTPAKRKEFLGRIQTGDYDAIIMHHDQFKKIPISLERAERIIIEQIEDLREKLRKKGVRDKQLEKSIKALEDKLTSERKRLAEWQDVGIFFEDLGIDHIMVDEAHYYRNIAIGSEEQGFSSKGSQFANDMLAKTDYLREIKGGATFFSGTPVVNSISEAYAIFRFMVPEYMQQTQTRSFDDWRTMYAELITKTERTITGAYKSKSSLFSFNNLTELKIQLRNFMDIKTTQDMSKVTVDGKLVMKLPQFRDFEGNITGEPITVQSEPSKWQDSYFIYSKARAEAIEYPVLPGGDNVLNIATDNRKASNSIKMIDPRLPEEEDGKIMKAIKSIVDVYNLPESKENKATQLVFLDQGTPKPKVKPPENLYFTDLSESEAQDAATRIDRAGYEPLIEEVVDEEGVSSWNVSPDDSDRFNLYQFFKDELVARGIPEDEIAFIHDYVSDTARTGLFADMNAGRKRIMFASTKKGGVGVNVQERALAIHNIDCPWTPADREQRIGRVWRQGNMFDSVMLFDHMTVNSFDGFMYTKVAKKGGMIALLFSNDLKARSITDDVSDDAEMLERQAAIASGRQDILEFENIKREYKALQSQASAHEMAQRKMERRMSSMDSDLARAATNIDNAETKVKKYKDNFGEKFNAKINNVEFDSPKAFGEKLVETIKSAIEQRGTIVPGAEIRPFGYNTGITVGEWNLNIKFEASPLTSYKSGFQPSITVQIDKHPYSEKFTLYGYGWQKTASELMTELLGELDPLGFAQRIRNMVKYPEYEVEQAKAARQRLLDEKVSIEKNIGKKFVKIDLLEELRGKYEAMDATVGAEIRSGTSGQFGSGEDVLPEGYWDEIYARKKAQKEAKDAPVQEVKEAAQAATTMNDNGIPPKAKPGGPIAGGTNLDDFFVDESKFESIRPLDAMLEFLAPGTRSAIARRTEILFRHLHGRQARVEAVVGHLLSGLRDYLDTRPVEEAHEFIDAIENGLPVPNGSTKTETMFKAIYKKVKSGAGSVYNFIEPDMVSEVAFVKKWKSMLSTAFGENHGIETLQDAADLIRVTFDAMREEINNLDPSKLNEFYEYYFPHIWQIDKSNPTKVEEWIIDTLGIKARKPGAGKRPMEGSKGFLKKRTIPTVKEGLEKGLKLVSDNPVDIMLLKIREMNKFLIATRFKEKSIADGTAKFVALGATPPAGYKKVNSTFMDVYSPGEITVKFAYDKKMHDKLMEIGLAAGASVEWKNSVGRGKAGGTKYGEAGGGQVNMRYGANLEVLTHEIGHILDDKFGLKKALLRGARAKKDQAPTKTDIIVSEIKELAKLRYESMDEDDVSDSYARYTERQPELIANFIHLYVHSKGLVKKFAPNALAAFKDLQKSNKVLKMLDDVVGGAELSEMETTYSVFGRTYTGAYYFPETAAQVINNYLSPGLSGTDKRILRDLYGWVRVSNNALNSIQLGFDGFHGLVTALNAAITDTETAIGFLEAGDVGKAVKSALSGLSLVRPLTYGFIRGQQLRNAYLSSYTEDENMAKVVDWIVRAGGRATPDPVYMNDFRRKLRIAARDMKNQEKFALSLKLPLQVVQGAWYTINALNETTSHWLMESLVPALKLYAFENIASVEMLKLAKQKPNYTDEDMNATLQRAWDSVDNRFGQMVYDNLFFDKFVKDAATITFRAFGWSYGTIREGGGAAVDTVKMLGRGAQKIAGAVGGGGGNSGGGGGNPGLPAMPDGSDEPFVPVGFTPRQRFMPALIGITALVSAIIQYLHTGKRPEELRDYMFPKNGEKNPDGSDQRLVVPTYTKDIEAWMTRPGATFEGKLAPWYTAFTAVISNQDFYGVKIANEKEGFLPVWKSRVEFIANEFVPVAFRKKNEFDNDGIALGPMTFSGQRWIGIMPAPMWTTRSEAIQKAYEFRAKRVAGIEKTREEQTSRDAVRFTQDLIFNNIEAQIKKDQKRSDAIVKRFEEIKAKYPKEVEQASKIVFDKVQNRPRTPIEIAMSNLSIEEIIEVRKVATRDEVIFIDQALSDKLSTLIHRGTLKNDDPMVLKATKAMEGKL